MRPLTAIPVTAGSPDVPGPPDPRPGSGEPLVEGADARWSAWRADPTRSHARPEPTAVVAMAVTGVRRGQAAHAPDGGR